MKKIGIMTFHSAHNYGALLQGYALQEKIKEMGHECKIINYRNKVIERPYKILKLQFKNVKAFIKSLIRSIIFLIPNTQRAHNFNKFIKNKFDLTEPYYTEKSLKLNPPKCDIYIAGSDQIWNTDIANGLEDAYTLNFGGESIKRISYAASIGNDKIEEKYKEIYKSKLQNLDEISVREEEAKDILQELIDKPIEVTLDPTLLLSKEHWESLLEEKRIGKEKYILAYIVAPNDDFYKMVEELSNQTGLKIVHFERRNKNYKNVLKSFYKEGPISFISLIKNAEYIITTSFHATVFSIIFNKKFIVVSNSKTSSRLANLLKKLNLNSRLISTLDDLKKLDYDEQIDYETAEKLLEKERNKSIAFLKKAIEN